MIGYGVSCDQGGSCANIEITVLFTEDFAFEEYGCQREVYHYNRYLHTINRAPGEPDKAMNVAYSVLENIALAVRVEEIRLCEPCKIYWRRNKPFGPEILKTEPIDNVWLPFPIIINNCKSPCINITEAIFSHLPKPLEVSLFCDILNEIFLIVGFPVPTPFNYCINSVFCSVDFFKADHRCFGGDFGRHCNISVYEDMISRSFKKSKVQRISKRSIISKLESLNYPQARFQGNPHTFAIETKREFTHNVADALLSFFRSVTDVKTCFTQIVAQVYKAVERYRSLAELFVLAENLEKTNDITYLSERELMSAFAFSEELLSLKKMVRKAKSRYSRLSNLCIADVVYPDCTISYINQERKEKEL